MSNATDKVAIANVGLLAIGQGAIASFSENTPTAVKVNSIFETVVKELLSDDWHFNRKRVLLDDLTAVNKIGLFAAPAPSSFNVGATLTGALSGRTCRVVEVLSSTKYLITEPLAAFTDGENLSDGTNTAAGSAGYPDVDTDLAHGSWLYGFLVPDDSVNIRGIADADFDEVVFPYIREGSAIFTNADSAYLHYNKWVGYQGSASVSDVTAMPVWFWRLISAKIAYLLSPNVTENARIRPKAELDLQKAWLEAKEHNGDEAFSDRQQGSRDWSDQADCEIP